MEKFLAKVGISKKMALVGLGFFFLYLFVAYGFFYADRHVADIDGNLAFHYPTWGYDSPEYTKLADGLLLRHSFNFENNTPPDLLRTPGYPLLLALTKLVTGKFWPIIIFQIFCALLVALLTFKMGVRLNARRVGIGAALLFLISPSTIFHTVVFMNELTFMTAFILSLYVLFFPPVCFQKRWWCAPVFSGLLLAVATYIRPLTLYIPLLFVCCYFLVYMRSGWGTIGKSMTAFMLVFWAVIIPWIYHNGTKSGVYTFSTIGTYNLVFFNASDFLEKHFGNTSTEFLTYQKQLDTIPMYNARPQKPWNEIVALPKHVLAMYPRGYIAYHLSYLSVFFISSGARYDVQMIHYPKVKAFFGLSEGIPSLLSEIKAHHFKGAFVTLSSQGVFTVERLLLCVLTLASLIAVFATRSPKVRNLLLVLLLIILYFAVLTGPASIPRYRLPVDPLIFLLGLFALSRYYVMLKMRKQKAF